MAVTLTELLPLTLGLGAAPARAAHELRREGLDETVQAGGRAACCLYGRLTVLAQPLQVQLRQLLEETLPFLLTQLRPEAQDMGLARRLQAAADPLQSQRPVHHRCAQPRTGTGTLGAAGTGTRKWLSGA